MDHYSEYAFPLSPELRTASSEFRGLTKREWVATHILAGIANEQSTLDAPKIAVELADALLKELQK